MHMYAYSFLIVLCKTGNFEENIKYVLATLRDRDIEMLNRILD